MESSPLGSLYQLLRVEEKGMVAIGSNNVHHILLQVGVAVGGAVDRNGAISTCIIICFV